ncbi:MAG: 3-hydroxyacyl-CoA dehydrogenase NAD-binding domain-containing protein [Candidatus Baltobacteraceae bacterium]
MIVVVGAGTMGAGIAFVAARAGLRVELVEPDASVRERALARLRKDAERASAPAALERISFRASIAQISGGTLAIEAVPERIELKHRVFAELAERLGPDAILATNTSSLSVGEIAGVVDCPGRVIGLHFFNPPQAMKLVEIVHLPQTDTQVLERAQRFVEACDKVGVLVNDSPGFVVNRVARPFYLQSLRALVEQVAPADALDMLARGVGFRMGPFELMDLIGLDINLATTESVYERTQAARFAPIGLQREMVAGGRLGRKSQVGFYEYADGGLPAHPEAQALPADAELNEDEVITIVGFDGIAGELSEMLPQHYARVGTIENDDLLDELSMETTIVYDVGDGVSDRSEMIRRLDTLLPAETVFFADAYATDFEAVAKRMRHPERLVGYGILSSLAGQSVVEIVDAECTGDDALSLSQEFFESIGKRVVLVENRPGLFLGRVVGSIINEAIVAVQEAIASADDIDLAMRLGTNYPIGPIAWGREIGGARVSRILNRLAQSEGMQFAPHRALWVLDARDEEAPEPGLEESPIVADN